MFGRQKRSRPVEGGIVEAVHSACEHPLCHQVLALPKRLSRTLEAMAGQCLYLKFHRRTPSFWIAWRNGVSFQTGSSSTA